MLKKLLVISTAAVFLFSPVAFAGGKGANGKAYSGSTGKGVITKTQTQYKTKTQTQSRLNTNKGNAAKNGIGIMTRDRIQKRDGSCK